MKFRNKIKKKFRGLFHKNKKTIVIPLEPEPSPKMPKVTLREKIKSFIERNEEKVKKLREFLFTVIGYGLLINYALWSVFDFKFNIFTPIGWGILFYLVSEEFINFVRHLFYGIFNRR